MGSAALLDSNPPPSDSTVPALSGKKKSETEAALKSEADNINNVAEAGHKKKKRSASESSEEPAGSRKMPKRAAACSNFKERSVRISEKPSIIETRKDQSVNEEIVAVHLTSGQEEGQPNRRLTDFVFHDLDGLPQPLEMLEVDDLFISGLILPLNESSDKEKEKGVRCEGFGRIEEWTISGYEDGYPVIWVSTDIADYDCGKPAGSYRKLYDQFFEKARACIEVYKRLSKSSGGNPDTSLDELLAGVARSMSGSKCFSGGVSIKDFVISQGEFIYNQLIGLDDTSKKTDQKFVELSVLIALRDESSKLVDFLQVKAASSGGALVIGSDAIDGENKMNQSGLSSCADDENENVKLAKLLQEEEYWKSMKQRRNQRSTLKSSKFYIKINEDEIANDYPLPAYYKPCDYEMDEYVIFDSDISVCDTDQLPRSMLHNWSLYNSDSRLISLELLPMKPCADIDVTIFGSGVMTADDGSGFFLDSDPSAAAGSGAQDVNGIPIYLSAIKEWMIEFGSSMVFISIRTDMAWYRLGKPSKQYCPWYETVLKTARLAISIITMLKEQSRVSRLSFADVIKKVSEYEKNHPAYISSNPVAVERYVVVHGQIILQQFAEFPDEKIKKCAFVVGLTNKMEERHHTKWIVKK